MVWILGCNGLLGKELGQILTENKITWIGTDSEVDVTDPVALTNFSNSHGTDATRTGASVSLGKVQEKISWIINCAAYTDIDKAEQDLEKATKINVDGAKNVSRIARIIGAKLVHISSDYVFDGEKTTAYTEDDEKNPINVYGKTKALAEDTIKKESTQYYIIRTGLIYADNPASYTNRLLAKIAQSSPSEEIKVCDNIKCCPTSAESLARIIVRIILTSARAPRLFGKNSALPYGIYNYTDGFPMTLFEFAKEIYTFAKKYGKAKEGIKIEPIASEALISSGEMIARRPKNSLLSNEKLFTGLGIKKVDWKQNLEKNIKKL